MMPRSRSQGTEVTIVTGAFYCGICMYCNHSTCHFTMVTVYSLLFVLKAQYNTALTMVYHSEHISNMVFVVKAE